MKRGETSVQASAARTHTMTEAEKLIRGIESLRETIRREWFNIRLDTLTHDDRVASDASAVLRDICPDQATPELMELSARLGSLMPYRKAVKAIHTHQNFPFKDITAS